ncbi:MULTISPECIES: hypothetical protein [unclassified Brucella]|nr:MULTISPECIES: hypothetical protein [unclassified Brucella]
MTDDIAHTDLIAVLVAVLVTVFGDEPRVMTARGCSHFGWLDHA